MEELTQLTLQLQTELILCRPSMYMSKNKYLIGLELVSQKLFVLHFNKVSMPFEYLLEFGDELDATEDAAERDELQRLCEQVRPEPGQLYVDHERLENKVPSLEFLDAREPYPLYVLRRVLQNEEEIEDITTEVVSFRGYFGSSMVLDALAEFGRVEDRSMYPDLTFDEIFKVTDTSTPSRHGQKPVPPTKEWSPHLQTPDMRPRYDNSETGQPWDRVETDSRESIQRPERRSSVVPVKLFEKSGAIAEEVYEQGSDLQSPLSPTRNSEVDEVSEDLVSEGSPTRSSEVDEVPEDLVSERSPTRSSDVDEVPEDLHGEVWHLKPVWVRNGPQRR